MIKKYLSLCVVLGFSCAPVAFSSAYSDDEESSSGSVRSITPDEMLTYGNLHPATSGKCIRTVIDVTGAFFEIHWNDAYSVIAPKTTGRRQKNSTMTEERKIQGCNFEGFLKKQKDSPFAITAIHYMRAAKNKQRAEAVELQEFPLADRSILFEKSR